MHPCDLRIGFRCCLRFLHRGNIQIMVLQIIEHDGGILRLQVYTIRAGTFYEAAAAVGEYFVQVYIPAVVQILAGFKQISVEPVVAPESADYAIKEEDVPILCEQYDILAKYLLDRRAAGKGVNFFHFMIDLSGGPCAYKRLSGCGSGCEYLAVAPNGDLYPCHQFVGMPDFIMGNVDTGVTGNKLRDKFKLCNVYSKEECKNCFAKLYCSGGCAANSYNFHGNINDAYDLGCELQRKRVECAIMLKAAMSEDTEGNT